MALLTVAEAKVYLRISTGTTTYNELIGEYIPLIEEDICSYCNNWFQDKAIFVEYSGGLAFNKGTTDTSRDNIVDDSYNFTSAGLTSGMDIAVSGGSNHGIHTVSSGQTTAILYMTSTGIFVNQDQDASYNPVGSIRISRIDWPVHLKPTAAKMIWYQIDKAKPDGAISERIDDYSITYAGARAYPMQLVNQLDNFKNIRSH